MAHDPHPQAQGQAPLEGDIWECIVTGYPSPPIPEVFLFDHDISTEDGAVFCRNVGSFKGINTVRQGLQLLKRMAPVIIGTRPPGWPTG